MSITKLTKVIKTNKMLNGNMLVVLYNRAFDKCVGHKNIDKTPN